MREPILFLDIDGVLNSEQFYRYNAKYGRRTIDTLCEISLANLEYIIEGVPNLKIVVSSTWRIFHDIESLREVFSDAGFYYSNRIVDTTPIFKDDVRGAEIKSYTDQHEISDYVIVDDDSDMLASQVYKFVQTNSEDGLTLSKAKKIVDLLMNRTK